MFLRYSKILVEKANFNLHHLHLGVIPLKVFRRSGIKKPESLDYRMALLTRSYV